MCKKSYIWVDQVPDSLDLRKSIAFVNERYKDLESGLALDIHFNANESPLVHGSEAYYVWGAKSKFIASTLSRNVANALGIRDRGAKPDSQTAVGSLGWLRKTNPWAGLVEVCYLSNKKDSEAYTKHGHEAVAEAIHYALLEIMGAPTAQEKVAYNIKRFKNL